MNARRRELVYRVLLLAAASLFAFGLLELAIRALFALDRLPPELASRDFTREVGASAEDLKWQRRFLWLYAQGQFVYGGMHVAHPTRGWVPKPRVDVTMDGLHYRTNERGQRSLPHPTTPDARTVLVLGDSFTFGIGADDAEVWPTILQAKDEHLRVVNLGVGGYGLDQMLVTLSETIGEYRPAAVVMAFIDEDLERSLLSFRDYAKPRYLVAGERLLLTNVPIPPIEETIARLERRAGREARPLFVAPRVLRNAWWQWRLDRSRSATELNRRIVEEAAAICARPGARFLLVHLAWGRSIADSTVRDEGQAFLRLFEQRPDIVTVETRDRFLAAGGSWTRGHYRAPEARLVAEVVDEALR